MKRERIAIRADASRRIGSGHVMRCAALAATLRARGAEVVFVCRELEGHYCDWLASEGYGVIRLAAPAGNATPGVGRPYADWLEVPLAVEIADASLAMATHGPFDWLIADHYALNAEWESAMRPYAGKLMAIDDLANRYHDVDLLLDQNLQIEADRYAGKLSSRCTQLLGPSFSLLRPEFGMLRRETRSRDGSIRRILIFAGGADPENFTMRALEACEHLKMPDISLDVVAGSSNPHLSALKDRCAALRDCSLHVQTPHMANLMEQADIMVGASGSTTWERCCLGLPAVLVSIADNQRSTGMAISRHRAACYLGDASDVSVTQIATVLARLIRRPSLVRRMAAHACALVDGQGAERVASVLLALPHGMEDDGLRLRPATMDDADLLLDWRNDPETRNASHHTKQVERDEHRTWLARTFDNQNRRLWIAEEGGVPVGSVRADYLEGMCELSWTVAPEARGRGIAKRMVARMAARISAPIRAQIKKGNTASIRVAECAGLQFESEAAGILYYRRAATE